MAELEKLREQVKLEIQSLLCTEKSAIPSYQLHKQYRSEIGSHIPFVKLGFLQLEDFLLSIPEVVSSYVSDGVLHVRAVPLEASSHINLLVQGQRKAKKKKSTSMPFNNWANRFKTFRVSSSFAPNRNYYKTNTFSGVDYNRTGGYSRPPFGTHYSGRIPFRPQSSFDVRSHLVPQVMQPMKPMQTMQPMQANQQSQKVADQLCRTSPVEMFAAKWKPVSPTPFSVANNNFNQSNNMNKSFGKMNDSVLTENSRTSFLDRLESPQNDRAHLKPQIMQPRPSTATRIASVSNESAINNKLSTVQEDPRANLKPQLMQPRVPVSTQIDNSVPVNVKTIVNESPTQEINLKSQVKTSPVTMTSKLTSPLPYDPNSMASLPISRWSPNESVRSVAQQLSRTPLVENKVTKPPIQESGKNLVVPHRDVDRRPSVSPSDLMLKVADSPVQQNTVAQQVSQRAAQLTDSMEKLVISHREPVQPKKQPSSEKISPSTVDPSVRRRVFSRPPDLELAPEIATPISLPQRAPRGLLKRTSPIISPSYQTPPVVRFQHLNPPTPDGRSNEHVPLFSPKLRPDEMFVERLQRLAQHFSLGKVSCSHSQMKNGNYLALMKVGLETFQSYPEEFASLSDAYEYVARMACQHIESTQATKTTPLWMVPAQQ